MKKTNVKNLIKTYALLIAIIIIAFASIFAVYGSINSRLFAEDENVSLSISKVKRYVSSPDLSSNFIINSTSGYYKANGENEVNIEEHENLDYIMLNNSNLELDNGSYLYESIRIAFQIDSSKISARELSIYYLSVSATLNGKLIDTGEVITLDSSLSNNEYEVFLTPNSITYNTQEVGTYNSNKLITSHLCYVDSNGQKTLVPYEEAQGYYEFTFAYRLGDKNFKPTETTVEYTNKLGFYLLDETSYINPAIDNRKNMNYGTSVSYNNNSNNNNYQYTEPRLSNIEYIQRNVIKSKTEENVEVDYFNFNNKNTVNYIGENESNTTKLLYPEYLYDASRYNISYVKTVYGVATRVTSQFFRDSATKGHVVFSHDVDGVIVKTETFDCIKQIKEQTTDSVTYYDGYFCSYPITDIGLYEFNIRFQINVNGEYKICDTAELISGNSEIIGDVRLYVFGYQLYYTAYAKDMSVEQSTVQKELKTDEIFSDTSFYSWNTFGDLRGNLNSYSNNLTSMQTYLSLKNLDNYKNATNREIAVTNQAPISFKFYSTLKTDDSTNQISSYSFYLYKKSNSPNQVQKELNNSTIFSENGTYTLYIVYTFDYYKAKANSSILNPDLISNPENVIHLQTFTFEIKNTEPTVTSYIATEEEYKNNLDLIAIEEEHKNNSNLSNLPKRTIINSRTYTNKPIYIKWKNDNYSPFNAPVYTKVTYKRGTQVVKTSSFSQSSYTYLNIEDKTYSEIYVDVYYGPYGSSIISYMYIIDKESISNIQLLQVEKSSANDSYLLATKSKIESNNIKFSDVQTYSNSVINSGFAVAWAEKNSGSLITATYTFLPISYVGSNQYANWHAGTNDNKEKIYSSSTESEENLLLDLKNIKSLALENGYQFTSLNKDIPYISTDIFTNRKNESISKKFTSEKTNSIISNAGLYIFTLTDSAGNSTTKVVLLDKTSPVALIALEGKDDNKFAIASGDDFSSKNTTIIWGSHKSLTFNSTTSSLIDEDIISKLFPSIVSEGIDLKKLPEVLNNYYTISFVEVPASSPVTKFIYSDDEKYYLAPETGSEKRFAMQLSINIPLTQVTEEFIDLSDNRKQYDRLTSSIKTLYTYINSTEYDATSETYVNEGDHIYTIVDESSIIDPSNFSVTGSGETATNTLAGNNKRTFKVEINLDNSKLKAYTTGEWTGNNTGKDYRLRVNASSNRQKLHIEWVESVGEYAIESVVYNYFALTYDVDSPNYPYSQSPTSANVDIRKTATLGRRGTEQVTVSGNINISQSTLYGTEITNEGMYEVIRTYKSDLADNTSGDSKVRRYYFYIDRTNIISSVNDSITIGDFISITMGKDTRFSGLDYLKENGNYNLSTNKLPVKLLQISNKFVYSSKDVTNIENSLSNIKVNKQELGIRYGAIAKENGKYTYYNNNKVVNSYNLTYRLLKNITLVDENNTTTSDFRDISLIDDNFKDGEYMIMVNDRTGYDYVDSNNNYIQNYSPISFSFRFKISNTKPDGDFIIINSDETNTVVNEGLTSINSTNFKYTWKDPSDDYTAKIDNNNIRINLTYENGGTETIYERVSVTVGNTTSAKVNINKYQITYRSVTGEDWDHEIDFSNSLFKTLEQNKTNCMLSISIQYEGNSSYYQYKDDNNNLVDFYSNTETLYLDFVAPQHNYEIVKANDSYYQKLSSEEKANFNDYRASINFENFAFEVEKDWKLTSIPTPDYGEVKHDTYKAYYRKYDKYANTDTSVSANNLQSLVPTDSRYNNYTAEPLRLRFDAGLKDKNNELIYTQIVYNDDKLPVWATNFGYYEIIEVDEAGNYRIYTIHISDSPIQIDYDYTTATNETQSDTFVYENGVNSYSLNKNAIMFKEVTSDSNPWLIITATDNLNQNSIDFKFSPVEIEGYYNNYDAMFAELNKFIVPYNTTTGNSFTLNFILHLNNDFVLNINTPGAKLEPSFEDLSGFFMMYMPNDTLSTYIKSLVVYKAENGKVEFGEYIKIEDDSEPIANPYIYSTYTYTDTNKKDVSYRFSQAGTSGSDFWFEFTDNFDRVYRVRHIFGILDEQYLDFTGNHESIISEETQQLEHYTAEQVAIKYQGKLYAIKIEKKINGVWVELTPDSEDEYIVEEYEYYDNLKITNPTTGMISINLIKGTEEQSIRLTLTNSAGNDSVYVVHYYLQLAQVDLKDSFENVLNITDNGNTTKNVYVIFDKDEKLFETKISGSITIRNADGTTQTKDLGLISNNQMLSDYGTYTLTIYNSLGMTITYTFTIKESVAAYYSVYSVNNQGVHTLLQSVRNTNFGGKGYNDYLSDGAMIQYYTIYDYIIECNADKNIVCIEAPNVTKPDENTIIYYIYTAGAIEDDENTFSTYIAVTKVPTNTMFMMNNATFGATNYSDSKLNTDKSNLSRYIINYPQVNYAGVREDKNYIYSFNTISVKYDYNNVPVGVVAEKYITKDSSGIKQQFELRDAGIYNLYFTDLAGNKNLFGVNDYLKVVLLNQVLFTLNGENPIDNSIFNSTVTLSIQQITSYDSSKDISVISTLNGKTYSPEKNGLSYTYSSYGVYTVTLSAKVSGETVTTSIRFTILNINEARYAFEYIPLNNYEIVTISKGDSGVNLLPNILSEDGVASLSRLTLSYDDKGLRGAGKYTITIKIHSTTLKPEQQFTFNVWINSSSPVITLSIEDGGSTTKPIQVKVNMYLIYTTIGECSVYLNDTKVMDINEGTAQTPMSTFIVNGNNTYVLRIVTNSGNTLLTRNFTKVEPLNTIAIIMIVVGAILVIGIVAVFIKLRVNMKVK